MSKAVVEYGTQKSKPITCAKRIAELLGSELVKDKGLCTKYIISKKPIEAPVAERAVPTVIFQSDPAIKKKMLRKWLKDFTIDDIDMRDVIDWDYYKERLAGTVLKILIIPAALQKIENPIPKIPYPDWVSKMMKNKSHEQKNLAFFFKNVSNVDKIMSIGEERKGGNQNQNQNEGDNNVDMEDLGTTSGKKTITSGSSASNKKNMMKSFIEKGKQQVKEKINFENESKAEEEDPSMLSPANMLDDFTLWLKQQKKKWKNLKTSSSNRNSSLLGNSQKVATPMKFFSNALTQSKDQIFKKSTLKIVQMLENPSMPGVVKLWVVFENNMECINVNIRKKIYINSMKTNVSDVFKPVKLTLPRNKPVMNLYEFDMEEKEFRDKFNNFQDYIIDPSIEGVYETKVPLIFRAIQDYGCQIKYCNKTGKKISANIGSNSFNFEDFEMKPILTGVVNEGENYLEEGEYSKYYIYHSTLGSRHFLSLFLFQTKKVYIFAISSINTKNVQMQPSKKIIQQCIENTYGANYASMYQSSEWIFENFEVIQHVEQDLRIVLKNVNRIIHELRFGTNKDLQHHNSPGLIILHSPYTSSKLIQLGLVTLQDFPVMEIPFNHEENNFPALDWIKFCLKKLAVKFIELNQIIDYRMQLSRYCNIPICNIEKDCSIFASDIIFSRCLKSQKQLLWYNSSGFPDLGGGSTDHDFLGEVDYEFPKISNPGMYLGYSVEIDLGLFCVNAIIESDHMKDLSGKFEIPINLLKEEKPNNPRSTGTYVLDYHLERDEFTLGSNAFYVMKKMVEKWLSDVKQYENFCADLLQIHFYRWVASFNSKFFDPVLYRMINKLMQRYFSILIRKIKDFGFDIIYADYKKIFIYNKKNDFNEFQANN